MDGSAWTGLPLILCGLTLFCVVGTLKASCKGKQKLNATHEGSYLYSPGYPGKYSRYDHCKWVIHASNMYVVRLDTNMTDLEDCPACGCDKIVAYDGSDADGNVIRKWCGNTKPIIFSTKPSLTLVFTTDGSVNLYGFSLSYRQVLGDCTQRLTATFSSKNFTSPDYPKDYPKGAKCTWYISSISRARIRLTVLDVAVYVPFSCSEDYISVFDGLTSRAALLRSFCGSEKPIFTSTGDGMRVEFNTGYQGVGRGFKLQYTAGSFDETVHTDLTAASFWRSLTSPAYPDPYPSVADYAWTIASLRGSTTVCIQTVHFDIEYTSSCTKDYVEMFDGNSEQSSSLGRKCGVDGFEMCSSGGYLFIKFHSDFYKGGNGFNISYKYIRSTPRTEPSSPTSIGPIVGSLVGIISVLFILCCLCKCHRRRSMRHTATRGSHSLSRPNQASMIRTVSRDLPPSNFDLRMAPPSYDDVIKTDLENSDDPPSYESLGISLDTDTIAHNNGSRSEDAGHDNPVSINSD